MQPHYYRVRQMEPRHRFGEVAYAYEVALCLNSNNNQNQLSVLNTLAPMGYRAPQAVRLSPLMDLLNVGHNKKSQLGANFIY